MLGRYQRRVWTSFRNIGALLFPRHVRKAQRIRKQRLARSAVLLTILHRTTMQLEFSIHALGLKNVAGAFKVSSRRFLGKEACEPWAVVEENIFVRRDSPGTTASLHCTNHVYQPLLTSSPHLLTNRARVTHLPSSLKSPPRPAASRPSWARPKSSRTRSAPSGPRSLFSTTNSVYP